MIYRLFSPSSYINSTTF